MSTSSISPTKKCTKCGIEKPATAEFFPSDKRMKNDFSSWCKECRKRKCREHYHKNREKLLEQKRLAYQNGDGERQRQASAAYRKAHPHWGANYQRQYREKFPELCRFRIKRAVQRRGGQRIVNQKYRLRLREVSDSFTSIDWERALDYFGHCCAICNRPLNGLFHHAAMDHWIPISAPDCPGTIPTNILPLCHGKDGCNNSKSNTPAQEWLEWKYGKRKARKILNRIQEYFDWIKQCET